MKKLMSIIVSILFAMSLSGLVFAQSQEAKPAGEPVRAVEKAPAKEKKKTKANKEKKAEKAQEAPPPPAAAPSVY